MQPDLASGFFGTLVRRPVTLLVAFASMIVIGLIAYARIPLQMMPDGIDEPGLWLVVPNPGASAAENEEKVARVVEEQLRTLAGIEDIESESRDDMVTLQVIFSAHTQMDIAKAEARDRLERARPQLPTTVQEMQIFSWSQSDLPVMFYAILHPGDSAETDFLIDSVIQRRIDSVDGVGQSEIWGVLDDSLRILLDQDKVRAHNLDLGALIGRLSRDNFALPLGEVNDGGRRVLLRSDMRFKSREEILGFPIGNGLVIADIGTVEMRKSVRNRLFRIDGSYAYYGEVRKDSQANVVATCDRVRAAFAELEADPRLKGDFKFLPLFDQGEFIRGSLGQLAEAGWYGGLIAILILFVFLWRIRLTLAVSLSIPVSVVFAIGWLYFSGGSFNVLTMTGVTLAMGMLVDNSIVVIENIVRLKQLGRTPAQASAEGTREVALAVLLSTLTSVVVFMPMIFMTENPQLRIIFGELGLPLCISLLFSLLVSIVFLPVIAARILTNRPAWLERLAARWVGPVRVPVGIVNRLVWVLRGGFHVGVALAYRANRSLVSALTPWRWVLAAGVVALAAWALLRSSSAQDLALELVRHTPSSGGSYAATWVVLGTAFALFVLLFLLPRWRRTPRAAPERPTDLRPRGHSLLELGIRANHRLLEWSLENRPLASLLALVALLTIVVPQSNMEMAAFGEDENKSRASLYVELEDNFDLAEAEQELLDYEAFLEGHRPDWGFDHLANRFDRRGARLTLYWDAPLAPERHASVLRELTDQLPKKPGHRTRLGGDSDEVDPKSRNLVVFRLLGPDADELQALGERAVAILERIDGLSGVRGASETAPQEIHVRFDSDLAQQFDLSSDDAFQNIAWALRGWLLPRYQEPGREIPLVIEYDDAELPGLATLRDMTVFGRANEVALSSFSRLEFARGERSIQRRNGQTSTTISARVENPLDQPRLSQAGYQALKAELDLPRGYSIGEEDLADVRAESEMKELKGALWLSMALVFLLMGILFESISLPIAVMFSIPFAALGALWTLYLTGTTMDSVGWIGIIILVGVVVNNGIVLVDRIHQLARAGWERKQAVLEGCANRVRPVVMTALTTVFALIPSILAEPPAQGIDYRALSTCVAGGMALSTFFTLWVVPLAYTLIDDLSKGFLLAARRAGPPAAAPHTAATDASA